MNRDRPATMLTKREHAALTMLTVMLQDSILQSAEADVMDAVSYADTLFDVLDTPAELRDEPYFDHEGTP